MSHTNAIDPEVAKRWISEWERHDEEILTIKMENAARQKVVKDRQKEVLEAAVSAGLPREAFKLEIKLRTLARKQDALESDAGKETVDLAEQIREALGDFGTLPLGGAAIEAVETLRHSNGTVVTLPKRRGRPRKDAMRAPAEAANSNDGAAALDSLVNPVESPGAPSEVPFDTDEDVRPRFMREADETAAAANEAALVAGISKLN